MTFNGPRTREVTQSETCVRINEDVFGADIAVNDSGGMGIV